MVEKEGSSSAIPDAGKNFSIIRITSSVCWISD